MRMSPLLFLAVSAALATAGLSPLSTLAQDLPAAHAHILHVQEAFSGTPDGEGLLAVAIADAETAAQHAQLSAGGDPTDIDPMIRHARHVLHAVDPTQFPNGPGSGFGLKAAADAIVRHIEMAAATPDASDNVRTHAAHVAAAARAIAARAERITAKVGEIVGAGVYNRAYPLTGELAELTEALAGGEDLSGDGTISLDEGGLNQVEQHLNLMAEGEGL
ncbi:MAG: hypothetical protein OYK82_06525 [Gammaproteobacteria bacterium]|nr:hypothetical protein [Gammaproteobacteria bacterium]